MIPHNRTSQDGTLAMPSHEELAVLTAEGRRLQAQAISAALGRVAVAIGGSVGGLAQALRARRKAAQARRHLESLDDRMLADIGLTRGDIRRAVVFGPDHAVTPVPQLGGAKIISAVNDSGQDRQVA